MSSRAALDRLSGNEPTSPIPDEHEQPVAACSAGWRCAVRPPLGSLAQALRFGQRLQLLQRAVLDLAHALARDLEGAPDLLERERAAAREAVAQFDHLPLTPGQRRQHAVYVLPAQSVGGELQR